MCEMYNNVAKIYNIIRKWQKCHIGVHTRHICNLGGNPRMEIKNIYNHHKGTSRYLLHFKLMKCSITCSN